MTKRILILSVLLVLSLKDFSATTVNFTAKFTCSNEETVFISTSSSKDSMIAFNWDFNNDGNFSDASGKTSIHFFGVAGTYQVGLQVITDVGDTVVKYKTITISEKPTADFNSLYLCSLDSTFFQNTTTYTGGQMFNYIWEFGDGEGVILTKDPYHLYGTSGTFNVRLIAITDRNCKDTIVKPIVIYPTPDYNLTFIGDTVFFEGRNVTIKLDHSYPDYLWSDSSTADSLFVTQSGDYSVTVTDSHNCSASRNQKIIVIPKQDLVSVDLVTPNNDGVNDVWTIKFTGGWDNIEVNVYNRAGDLVYNNPKYQNDWAGTRDGKELPSGVYFYVITLHDNGKIYKGTLTLIR